METVRNYFGGLQNHCRWWLQLWNQKTLAPCKKSYYQPTQHIKKQRYYFANKRPSSQGYGFSSGHVWMWELDCEQGWAPKNWCFWTVVLEKTLESERGQWKSWLKAQHSGNEDHGLQSHHFMTNRWGNSGNSVRFYFLGLQNYCRWWLKPWN